mmetsp:Transcript_38549/g.44003  ORF Transcript_38549/g.44003 Transcript_38549/m.44003 type:complete len:927 (+) Transcript_38549:196-2976(+)
MPAIHLFRRRTLLGGDDLQLPCIATISLRVVQVFCFLLPIVLHIKNEANNDNDNINWWWEWYDEYGCRTMPLLLFSYVVISSFVIFVSIGIEYQLYRTSGMGCPIDMQPRSNKVERLLVWKLLAIGTVAQLLLVVLGIVTVSFAWFHYTCEIENNSNYFQEGYSAEADEDDFWKNVAIYSMDDESILSEQRSFSSPSSGRSSIAWWIAFCFLWLTQFSEFMVVSIFLGGLLSQPPIHTVHRSTTELMMTSANAPHQNDNNHELVEQMYTERCTSFCECLGMSTCFLFGGKNMSLGNYGAVARALSDYFENGNLLDLVPSDIVMGLMILRIIQKKRTLESRNEVIQESKHNSTSMMKKISNNSNNNTSHQKQDLEYISSSSHHSSNSSFPHLIAPTNSFANSNDSYSNMEELGNQKSFFRMHNEGNDTFYEPTKRKILDFTNDFDRITLQEGTRFARYQLAMYTWLVYIYMYPVTGLARLVFKSTCDCADSSCVGHNTNTNNDQNGRRNEQDYLMQEIPSGLVVGDNWCGIHKAALLLQAGINDSTTELVYAQLHSSFSDIPYCIIIDHTWKSIVLAIRGTFSLEDCVTDVLIEPESLKEMGDEFGFDGEDQYCHGGIVSCARIVYRDLQTHGTLDKLLYRETGKYSDYTLRIVGHSLGGGTATLLSFMLRQRFPTLRCINYSPPGCSFTWQMANECKDWCNSFVLGSDLVPRLTLDSLEFLRDEVLGLIGRVKVPKAEVARKTLPSAKYFCPSIFLQKGQQQQRDNLRHDTDSISELVDSLLTASCSNDQEDNNGGSSSDYNQSLRAFRSVQGERRSKRGHVRSVKLYPPGRMVHFMKTGEKESCLRFWAKCFTCCTTNFGSEYTPVWIKNDDLNEIVISSTMGTDHFPNRLAKTMQDISEEYGLKTNKHCSLPPSNDALGGGDVI